MTERTRTFLDELTERARSAGLRVLVEVHAHWRLTLELASASDLTYDFALPPLVLDALHTGDAAPLHRWLELRPHNVVTVLDTHDGIGVIDVGANAGHGGPPPTPARVCCLPNVSMPSSRPSMLRPVA